MILIFNYNDIDIDNNVINSNTNIHIINKIRIISLLLCKYLPFLVNDNDDDVNDNTDTNDINTNTINKLIDNIFNNILYYIMYVLIFLYFY